jgi:hypothetical protein
MFQITQQSSENFDHREVGVPTIDFE